MSSIQGLEPLSHSRINADMQRQMVENVHIYFAEIESKSSWADCEVKTVYKAHALRNALWD